MTMIGGKSLLFVFIVSLTYTSVFGRYMFEETRLQHNKRKGVITRHFANFRIFALDEFELLKVEEDIVYHNQSLLGNSRTTTKLTTTTSVDWEKTGTRTQLSAGKRKLKMQSVGRSTTTLNVNTNVKL